MLLASAANPGAWGDNIRVDVDYDIATPAANFNLSVTELTVSEGRLTPARVRRPPSAWREDLKSSSTAKKQKHAKPNLPSPWSRRFEGPALPSRFQQSPGREIFSI